MDDGRGGADVGDDGAHAAHWTPDRAAYRGLADTYVEDERFRSFYDDVETGLAAWLRDAMDLWADANLS